MSSTTCGSLSKFSRLNSLVLKPWYHSSHLAGKPTSEMTANRREDKQHLQQQLHHSSPPKSRVVSRYFNKVTDEDKFKRNRKRKNKIRAPDDGLVDPNPFIVVGSGGTLMGGDVNEEANEVSFSVAICEGDDNIIHYKSNNRGIKMNKTKKRCDPSSDHHKNSINLESSPAVVSHYFQKAKAFKGQERDEVGKKTTHSSSGESNFKSVILDVSVPNGAAALAHINERGGKRKKRRKKGNEEVEQGIQNKYCNKVQQLQVNSPYFQKLVKEKEGDEKRTESATSMSNVKSFIVSRETTREHNKAKGAVFLSDDCEGDDMKKGRMGNSYILKDSFSESEVVSPCLDNGVKVIEDDEKKTQPSFPIKGNVTTTNPASDGNCALVKMTKIEDVLSQFTYKGSSRMNMRRDDTLGKNVLKSQVLHPHFVKVAAEEKRSDVEKDKSAEPSFGVKETVPNVDENDTPFLPSFIGYLKEERGQQNETEILKFSSKRRRNDRKGHNRAHAEVRIVSRYFKTSVGKQGVLSEEKDPKRKSAKLYLKNCPTVVRVSPYFQSVSTEEENAISDSSEGRPVVVKKSLLAVQKLNEAYRKKNCR
ncbi:hypothetical protein F0562_011777 [Nyssa sinensis]|uniref:Uncharacterized protein n=1 Tax=Nyssa sinensis TaxID=561372 RepID=A0A5J4ZRL3_9ASTE|nr:hypothetical protein F0562_011777 [Nyssa sinensis]